MDDEFRVSNLLELARQHMQRFHELEEIEWKINFSIWGGLGGFAYLFATKNLRIPVWITGGWSILYIAPAVLALHGIALYQLNRQQQKHAELRDGYRHRSALLLTRGITAYEPSRPGGIRVLDWGWIGWDLTVTLAILYAAILLLRSLTIPGIK